jgi:hypothetical protein
MKKGNTISTRLKSWRELLEDIKECRPEWLTSEFGSGAKPSPEVLKAAKYFNLDLTKKDDSALLLRIMAEVVFPPRGRQKGNKQWGVDRLVTLGKQWLEIQRVEPGISDEEAARKISNQYHGQYQSKDTIRPRLPDARLMIGWNGRKPDKVLSDPNSKKGQNEVYAALGELHEVIENHNRLICIWLDELRGSSRARRREALKKIPVMLSKGQKALGTARKARISLQAEASELERKVAELKREEPTVK